MNDIETLANTIRYHNERYFGEGATETPVKDAITDTEYDLLIAQMKELDPNHPVLAEVGAETTYGKKVTHPEIMGSLTKAHYGEEDNDISELLNWRKNVVGDCSTIICMPKIDGLAVRLVYKHGSLVLASTRGNGTEGMDVTDNIKQIQSIPNSLNDFSGEFRGEIHMKKSDFEVLKTKMIEEGKEVPANPRNMAAGTLNQKDPKKTGNHPLHFFCYNIEAEEKNFDSEMDKWLYSAKNLDGKIHYVNMTLHSFNNKEDILKKIQEWEAIRDSLDYGIDGLVFSANDANTIEDLGMKGKCPVAKIAFKFRPQQATTKIEGITWQLGRTGRLTPVAKITPTDLDGSVIDSPTLHNYAQIKKKNISIGATVIIEKAGDIIPQIVRVTEEGSGDIDFPAHCPACDSKPELDEKEVSVWCMNPVCPGKAEFRIIHFLKTLETKDVGPAAVHAMFSHNIINDLPDLYNIDLERLKVLPGYGAKSAKKITKEIESKREIELSVFLDSLGITGLGTTTSKMLADKFETLSRIQSLTPKELTSLEGIADLTAGYICNGLKSFEETIKSLVDTGVVIKDKKKATGNLSGKSFCVTGTLSVGRKEMTAMIEAAGGTVKKSVGKGLDYLVAGEGVGKGKTDKADKYGTKILTENELRSII